MLEPEGLRADCSRCLALCCVVPALTASADFAITKPAGTPCPYLDAGNRCTIHDRLRDSGFPGCAAYDCFGAGQRVSESALASAALRPGSGVGGWSPEGAPQSVRDAFGRVRRLLELLWHLGQADALLAALPGPAASGLRAEVHACRQATAGRLDEALLQEADGDRRDGADPGPGDDDVHALALLRSASQMARAEVPHRTADLRGADLLGADLAGTDLRGADLRGATLVGAVLRQADLSRADLAGADLRGADLRGADLSRCLFLTQAQLDAACGDARTKLDPPLERPGHWARVADPFASQAPTDCGPPGTYGPGATAASRSVGDGRRPGRRRPRQ